jgi:excisionase family DNA binding protein
MASTGTGHGQSPCHDGGDDELLTVAETAGLLRVSKMTVYRLVHSGDIPGGKIGKSIRMRRRAVESYRDNALKSNTTQQKGKQQWHNE